MQGRGPKREAIEKEENLGRREGWCSGFKPGGKLSSVGTGTRTPPTVCLLAVGADGIPPCWLSFRLSLARTHSTFLSFSRWPDLSVGLEGTVACIPVPPYVRTFSWGRRCGVAGVCMLASGGSKSANPRRGGHQTRRENPLLGIPLAKTALFLVSLPSQK